MTRVQIKNKFKALYDSNSRLFIGILLLYFGVIIVSLSLTYVICYPLDLICASAGWPSYLKPDLHFADVSGAVQILLCAPFLIIFNRTVFALTDGTAVTFKESLLCLKEKRFIKKSLSVGVFMALINLIISVVRSLSGICMAQYIKDSASHMAITRQTLSNNLDTSGLAAVAILITVLLFVTFGLFDFTYSISVLYPEKSALWAAGKSVKTIVKHLGSVIVFYFSFIPWFLLSIPGVIVFNALRLDNEYFYYMFYAILIMPLMMGVGFYVWPYFTGAKAIFCRELIAPQVYDSGE